MAPSIQIVHAVKVVIQGYLNAKSNAQLSKMAAVDATGTFRNILVPFRVFPVTIF